jgi:uncharacterized damage-inducible protein DinB
MSTTPPDYPAGSLDPVGEYDEAVRSDLVNEIDAAPANLRRVVADLSEPQLDTRYKNWTIRQIVHHLADSHVHVYIRFKWTLTESTPTIKAYEEGDWVQLDDAKRGAIEPSLALLDGLHAKWVQLVNSMNAGHFLRAFVHPQTGETVNLWSALNYYPWHCRHHTGQILWLRDRM